jgi:hypothetical protein
VATTVALPLFSEKPRYPKLGLSPKYNNFFLTVFYRLDVGIIGPSPTFGMDVCLRFSVFVFHSVGKALRRADPPPKE